MEIDDEDGLNQFFSMLTMFNGNKEINTEFRIKMEEYFAFKWKHNRNSATSEEQDIMIM